MSWRDITVAELFGRPAGRSRRTPARSIPVAAYAMEAMQTITRLAALSVTVLLLVAPLVTAVPALAASSRLLAKAAHGQTSGLWREQLLDTRRATPVAWPLGLAAAAGVLLTLVNLAFLAGQPSLIAVVLYAVNVSGLLLGLWWTAACVAELADEPNVSRGELLARATRRAARFGRWHLAVLLGAGVAAALFILAPLVGVLFGPGLAIRLGRVRPDPTTPTSRGDL